MNVHQLLFKAKKILNQENIESSGIDSELLLSFILNKSREYILTHPKQELSPVEEHFFWKLIKRRSQGEPIAYLTGKKEFCGLEFEVNQNTLIPRPETEILVEKILEYIEKNFDKKDILHIFDIGTGSGCIITAVAQKLKKINFSNTKFYAGDVLEKTLAVAQKNAQRHLDDCQIIFRKGDLLNPFIEDIKKFNKKDHVIFLANLPYLSQCLYENTPISVKNYEPRKALYSKQDGLNHYKRLFSQIKIFENNFNWNIALEFSPEQEKLLEKLIKDFFPKKKIALTKDLSDKMRICMI
jgi:release factor glutamine methyltransferase